MEPDSSVKAMEKVLVSMLEVVGPNVKDAVSLVPQVHLAALEEMENLVVLEPREHLASLVDLQLFVKK